MKNEFQFNKLTTVTEMLTSFSLINLLSPQLNYAEYEISLNEMVPHHYYQLAVLFESEIIAISGFWIATKLYSGRYLEIDNFIVSEKYRNQGIGKMVLNWFEEEAKRQKCKVMMLDAYVENFSAHRFYYKNGFIARGFHFLKELN